MSLHVMINKKPLISCIEASCTHQWYIRLHRRVNPDNHRVGIKVYCGFTEKYTREKENGHIYMFTI